MPYAIGTDEAGYAPNLGPLVISATVWRVPENPLAFDWYDRLAPAVVRCENGKQAVDAPGLVIADSKAVYHNGTGLAVLERAVLAALACAGRRPANWRTLWEDLGTGSSIARDAPWDADYDCDLPLAEPVEDLDGIAERLKAALDGVGIELRTIRSRALFPDEFNERLAADGNKAEVLSRATVQLVADILAELPDERVWVICDKHGGRNRYGPILQRQFPDPLIEVRLEAGARSVYRWRRAGHEVQAHFCVRGEAHLPIALASMTAKYLREGAMRAFNDFWQRRLANLRPTAGYPLDARRFKADIAMLQQELGIADDILWRQR